MTTTTGTKYGVLMTAAQIATAVRGDIKELQAEGTIPSKADGFTYRVQSRSYSQGQAVDVYVIGNQTTPTNAAWAFGPANRNSSDPKHVWALEHGTGQVITDHARALGRTLLTAARAYTRDDTNPDGDSPQSSCWTTVHAGLDGISIG